MKRIGIVGGGQLGKMLAEAAHKLGFFVTVLDPGDNCPASTVADAHIVGSFKDKEMVLELGKVSDVVTFEIESANAEALLMLMEKGIPVHPNPGTLAIIKDKFGQKVFLDTHGIAIAPFAVINSKEDALKQAEIFGYPFLLKTRFDAYDGRGNFVIRSSDDIDSAYDKFGAQLLYAEKFVPFVKELAVVSARGIDGTIVSFPVVETIHKNNICHIVKSPALVSFEVREKAAKLAEQVLSALSGVGVFAVEMFLTESGDVLVNEIALRVHNSGHHTIEAFHMSQFEAHIRAITGMELVKPEALAPASVMINILGERAGMAVVEGLQEALALGNVAVHIYGKEETKPERKMGHITVWGDDAEEVLAKAVEARKRIGI